MMREEQFFDESVFYRIYVSALIFFWMRCRVYSAWMVAESICVLNGIGVYPESSCPRAGQGPTKIDHFRYFVYYCYTYLFYGSYQFVFIFSLSLSVFIATKGWSIIFVWRSFLFEIFFVLPSKMFLSTLQFHFESDSLKTPWRYCIEYFLFVKRLWSGGLEGEEWRV